MEFSELDGIGPVIGANDEPRFPEFIVKMYFFHQNAYKECIV